MVSVVWLTVVCSITVVSYIITLLRRPGEQNQQNTGNFLTTIKRVAHCYWYGKINFLF